MTIELTDTNFEELVMKSSKPVVVDFWASWCGPCNMIAPAISEIGEDFKDTAIVGKLNVDANPLSSQRFGIRNIPAVLYFKGGVLVDKQIGAAQKSIFVEKLKKLL
jgi:thioredoxin 1